MPKVHRVLKAMLNNQSIYRFFVAGFFMLTVMLPVVAKAMHIHDHSSEHELCDENSQHYHNAYDDCDICLFSQMPFSYSIQDTSELNNNDIVFSGEIDYKSKPFSINRSTKQLRAPPFNS